MMTKKMLLGMLVGTAATYAAWKTLAPEKKAALKEKVDATLNETVDYVTDYALEALDIVDDMMNDSSLADKVSNAAETVNNVTDKVKNGTSKVVNKMTNDDFDQQTAAIREELAQSQPEDDIVIDATTDADENSDK